MVHEKECLVDTSNRIRLEPAVAEGAGAMYPVYQTALVSVMGVKRTIPLRGS